jgi:hypothetical protein
MGLADIAGLGEAIKTVTRIANITERLMNDSGIKQKFEDTGKITGAFSLEGYRVKFEVEKEIKEIQAAE